MQSVLANPVRSAPPVQILRAAHLGMCFGVRDAIELAYEQARQNPLTVLGDLVHNETVLEELRQSGIRVAQNLANAATSAVMITAHGASDKAIGAARARGFDVIDAACPLVRRAHRALRELVRQGYHPVIIGQRNHVEVRGLAEDFDGCDIVLCETDINAMATRARFGIISQTTQPSGKVRFLVEHMRQRFPDSEIRHIDTVCRPTKDRQAAAIELAQKSDAVIVIGGAHSNNTRELAATCGRFCRRVRHVQSAADLREEWFEGLRVIGITAGTSTPEATIDEVEAWLRARVENVLDDALAALR